MKILSLTQPWATLIAVGAKKIETRSWGTSYRGPLAIHAAKNLNPVEGMRGLVELCNEAPFHEVLVKAGVMTGGSLTGGLPLGAIVAVCTVAECCAISKQGLWAPDRPHSLPGEPERSFGNYAPGRFAWLLADVKPLREPLPYRGAQGLRTLADSEVIREIYARAD